MESGAIFYFLDMLMVQGLWNPEGGGLDFDCFTGARLSGGNVWLRQG